MKKIIVISLLMILGAVSCASAAVQKPKFELPEIHGFAEGAYAQRLGASKDVEYKAFIMGEARLQLKSDYFFDGDSFLADWQMYLSAKGDLVYDAYDSEFRAEVRELFASFTPTSIMDVKAGRQVLTWGTGDLLFLNDLFPKDYISFFIGRDVEYLKLPSDALRVMLYPEWFNIDLVWIPFFEPNAYPKGDRISFFDTFKGGITGKTSEIEVTEPSRTAKNMVYAARVYRNFSSYETALYYYRGFDPAPNSYKNELNQEIYHQRLDAYGASVRGPVFGGIGSLEVSYYYSPEDPRGKIRTIQNSMVKYLAGYEKDLGNDLRIGFQYYVEQMMDYKEYKAALLPHDFWWYDRYRHVLTNRITKFFANQTIKATIFTFWSPSDQDVYVRPSLAWNATDSWTLTVGANLPWGQHSWTTFGSVQDNKNVFMRLRYSF